MSTTPAKLRGKYNSSKGVLKLSEMNEHHIRRAIVKRKVDLLLNCYTAEETNLEFLQKVALISRDRVINSLKRELRKRI